MAAANFKFEYEYYLNSIEQQKGLINLSPFFLLEASTEKKNRI
jgi:hypothetical protein